MSSIKRNFNSEVIFHAASDIDMVYRKCLNILNEDKVTLKIHALESAIDKAMNVVLKLQKQYPGKFDVFVATSSVDLINNLQIIADTVEPRGLNHSCGAMHLIVEKIT